MSIVDKLRSINSIKKQIANAIANKGVSINDATPLSEYPSKINSIVVSSIDTTAPVVDSFTFIVNVDRSVSFNGKTESGVSVLLRNPNAKLVPISLNDDGSFTAKILAPVIQGTYTLIVADAAGNTTTVTKEVTLPVIPVDPIVSLFGSNVEGAYYDINDLSTLFQDSLATIPVTEVGQTIGCIKDKSGNKNHLIQPTVSRQPRLTRDELTGSYGLAWDGVDDVMYAPIPSFVSTSIHMFFSQRYSSVYNSLFQFYLSESAISPANNNNRTLWLTTSYDGFYTSIWLKHFRATSNAAQRTVISTLRNVFSSKHILNQTLVLYYNKERIPAPNYTYQGLVWVTAPMFIGLTGNGVTYKAILIGRELTDSEVSMVQDILNVDVGAW